jgi:aryl-alcohol dehydrogenase-like predicted oxidoreductase
MQQRQLGNQGLSVSAVGYGAMVLEGYYGGIEWQESIKTVQQALDLGVNFIDSSDAYGGGKNEEMIGQAIAGRRQEVILATKFGIVFEPQWSATEVPTNWGYSLNINGTPEYARHTIDQSLKRLNTDYIDLWYIHFPDPSIAIEETVGAMAEAVHAGKVRYLGLSNVSGEQLRRANTIHPISAVQNEYSLFQRTPEADILPTAQALGVGFVPWSPLGAGFLSNFASGEMNQVPEGDFRNNNPRFQAENIQQNIDRFAPLRDIAEELKVSVAQLAIAWLLHQGKRIVPIPGTRKASRIAENAASTNIQLSAEHLAILNERFPSHLAIGKTLLG